MPGPKTCTKCGATGLMPFESRMMGSIFTGRTIYSAVRVTRYVCPDCGFVEEWVEGDANLEKLRAATGRSVARPHAS